MIDRWDCQKDSAHQSGAMPEALFEGRWLQAEAFLDIRVLPGKLSLGAAHAEQYERHARQDSLHRTPKALRIDGWDINRVANSGGEDTSATLCMPDHGK